MEFKNQYSDGRKVYYNDKCKNCENKEICNKSQNTRVISAYSNEQAMQRMKIKYEENIDEYGKRGSIEGIFGHIKYISSITKFITRGTEKGANMNVDYISHLPIIFVEYINIY